MAYCLRTSWLSGEACPGRGRRPRADANGVLEAGPCACVPPRGERARRSWLARVEQQLPDVPPWSLMQGREREHHAHRLTGSMGQSVWALCPHGVTRSGSLQQPDLHVTQNRGRGWGERTREAWCPGRRRRPTECKQRPRAGPWTQRLTFLFGLRDRGGLITWGGWP